MEEIILECSEMTEKKAAFAYIAGALGFVPEACRDLDGLGRCLREIGEETEITFEDVDLLEIYLGDLGDDLLACFEEAAADNENISLV